MDNHLEDSIGGQRILGGRLEVMGDSGLAPCLQLLAWARLLGRVVFSFQAEDEALLSEEDDRSEAFLQGSSPTCLHTPLSHLIKWQRHQPRWSL